VHLPFNFQLIDAAWDASALMRQIAEYEGALPDGGWPNWVLGNHDRPRAATRFGEAQARVAAMLLLTLRGTPTIYYGDEVGMGDVSIPADRVQDPRELREPGKGLGRDPVRTPMAWDGSPMAGFTRGSPWLPLHDDWPARNVAAQREAAGSMWRLYRDLLALRRRLRALAVGDWAPVACEGDVLAFARRSGDERVLVVLNLGGEAARVALPEWAAGLEVVLSTRHPRGGGDRYTVRFDGDAPRAHMESRLRGNEILLAPDEGVILA
jgi:alpha-glucosidase